MTYVRLDTSDGFSRSVAGVGLLGALLRFFTAYPDASLQCENMLKHVIAPWK